jgi:hypothetical protein
MKQIEGPWQVGEYAVSVDEGSKARIMGVVNDSLHVQFALVDGQYDFVRQTWCCDFVDEGGNYRVPPVLRDWIEEHPRHWWAWTKVDQEDRYKIANEFLKNKYLSAHSELFLWKQADFLETEERAKKNPNTPRPDGFYANQIKKSRNFFH